jgi:hypothetical protein
MILDLDNNPITEAGGWTTAVGSVLLQVMNSLNITDINPYLTAFTTVAGFVFLVYKILNMRLRNKMLKRKLKNADREDPESE